ncbi:helix-turn-helix domain-containing protein [Brevibacillus ginsengisoli]|uniref:helix-turn-helix domain-containing protein n=1 Tax=Brevibacillus ginsengisoli TaxID=363854 RepID=UPI003CEF8209
MNVYDVDVVRMELRDTIRKYMNHHKLNQSVTAKRIAIGRTGFTKALSGTQLFTIETLEKLTEIFGMPPGDLYHLFYGECIEQRMKTSSTVFIMDKLEKFLRRCLEVGKFDVAYQLLELLLEHDSKKRELIYLVAESIFHAAEEKYGLLPTYKEPEYEQCLFLYTYYSQNETDFQSEKLAICYFRIYYMSRFDVTTSYERLVMLLSVIEKLPINEKIKAYDRVVTYFYFASEWNKTVAYAQILEKLTDGVDEYLYGHCLMIKSFAKKELGEYEEALQLTSIYRQLQGFEEFGYGNHLLIQIESGQLTYIDSYLEWLQKQDQIESGLSIVLKKLLEAKQFTKAKKVMGDFSGKFKLFHDNILIDKYCMKLQFSLSLLHIHLEEYETGIDHLLQATMKAYRMSLFQEIGAMIYTYEQIRQHATLKQQLTYLEILQSWKGGQHI